jgi:hypothetical protein
MSACGDSSTSPDAARDADTEGGVVGFAPDIPWLADGVPPLAFTPCPEGWHEVADEGGPTTCHPYPPDGPAEDCATGEAHFPGEPGCRLIGRACPEGDWADGLPADDTVIFVKPEEVGGDGSRDAPFGSLSEVPWDVRGVGWTVALAKGRHDGELPLRDGIVVEGACAAETILTGVGVDVGGAVVRVTRAGEAATLRNVSIVDSPVPGVILRRGRLVVEGMVISGAAGSGVTSLESSVLVLRDVVITSTRPTAPLTGRAIHAELGGRVEADRLIASGNRDVGVSASGAGSSVTLRDAVVRDTDVRTTDDTGGRAFSAQFGARIDAERVLLTRNHGTSVFLGAEDTIVTLRDVVVSDTMPEPSGDNGRGLGVQEGGRVEAERVVFSSSREVGLFATGIGTSVSLLDVVVRNTASRELDGDFGRAVMVQDGARLESTRLLVERAGDGGILLASPGTEATLLDTAVRSIDGREVDGMFGYGMLAQEGVMLDVTRARIDGVHELGLLATNGSNVTAQSLVISNVEASACDCDRVLGHGVVAADATITISDFSIRDIATCGLFVVHGTGPDTSLDVSFGEVRGATIGACVQIEDYDLDRLTNNVVFSDNDSSLEATELPVPELPQNIEP